MWGKWANCSKYSILAKKQWPNVYIRHPIQIKHLEYKSYSGLFVKSIGSNMHLCSFLKSQITLMSHFIFWWRGREIVYFLLLWFSMCYVLFSLEMFMARTQVQHYLWVSCKIIVVSSAGNHKKLFLMSLSSSFPVPPWPSALDPDMKYQIIASKCLDSWALRSPISITCAVFLLLD